MTVAYVDASALTKLVLDEPSSPAMRHWYVEAERIASSVVGGIETRRAIARQLPADDRVEVILRSVVLIEVDPGIAVMAASMLPRSLRTLDAIHLASARALGAEIDAFVTYDDRLAEAARALGLPVIRPA